MVQLLPIVYAEVLGEREASRVEENEGGLAVEASIYFHVAGKWGATLTCWDALPWGSGSTSVLLAENFLA